MGHRVRVLDNLSTGYAKNIARFRGDPKFEFVERDIRDAVLGNCVCEGRLCAGVRFREGGQGSDLMV